MKEKILYLDATVRDNSRTRILTDYLVSKLNGDVTHVDLNTVKLPKLDGPTLEFRNKSCNTRDFSDPMFDIPKTFAQSDIIVISAPFWDSSFPATLKRYVEQIFVSHLTFEYTETGAPKTLCKAKALYYVTTVGGYADSHMYGYGYIKDLAMGFLQIPETKMFSAEGLDIQGNDICSILEKTKEEIDRYFR